MNRSAIEGCLLGTAVGDAIGLPYEGLSRRRGERLFGEPTRHRLMLGRGMVSDDTEHTCMVAQSLIAAGDDNDRFAKQLARRFRLWLLGIPAGTGLATLKACLKLCFGVSPAKSGVFSAGNGPAMRSAILGSAIEDIEQLKGLVRVSTRITHTDPKAEYGALTVAFAALVASRASPVDGHEFLDGLRDLLSGDGDVDELLDLIRRAVESVSQKQSTQSFADDLGLERGVSGYVYHTVPVAVHAWLSHQHDFRQAVIDVIRCGGDTDSTAAIVGGIVGCGVGKKGIPADWLDGLIEWPRTVAWMGRLAEQLAEARSEGSPQNPLRLSGVCLLLRNVFFLGVVLTHGLRRLLPPY